MADYTDDFNRASIGANWTVQSGTYNTSSSLYLRLHCDSITGSIYYNASGAFAGDAYSQVVSASNDSYFGIGPTISCVAGANTFYFFEVNTGGSALVKVVAGSASNLATGGAGDASGTGTYRLERVGNTLTAKIGGTTIFTVTDNSSPIAAGGYAGCGGEGDSSSFLIDSWAGGDIASAASGKGYNYYSQL